MREAQTWTDLENQGADRLANGTETNIYEEQPRRTQRTGGNAEARGGQDGSTKTRRKSQSFAVNLRKEKRLRTKPYPKNRLQPPAVAHQPRSATRGTKRPPESA
ncbi:hypothetical protein F2Q70_00031057 [Brassica cretica]|nr:hypothetical protein F2Q70_00031057 [Brassica cretica]